MSASRTARIIIVGAGVIGLSTAYHLAKLGGVEVIVLEKVAVGDGSSSRAGGIVTNLLWTKTGVEARKISLRLFRELSDELKAYGYQYQAVGCLNLFSPQDWSSREALLPLYESCDVPFEIINAQEIHHRWKDLRPADDIIGLLDPQGGYSEPEQYVPALAQRCRDLDVDIRDSTTVTGFMQRSGEVCGVTTLEGKLEADLVICTSHSWTNVLLGKLGKQLPVKSFVHQRYVTAAMPRAASLPAVNANPHEAYLRPAAGNRVLVGGETADREDFVTPSLDFRMQRLNAPRGFSEELRNKVRPLLPLLDLIPFESEKVGLISFSLDGEPILGALPELPGILVGATFHSGGFGYNPVAGMLLAELALYGRTSLDIESFSPTRFDRVATGEYLNTKLQQKNAFSRRH